jgi:hypothetical protein
VVSLRADIAALTQTWDNRTTKKAKPFLRLLDDFAEATGTERLIALAPATDYDIEAERNLTWGFLGVTDSRLIFVGVNGQARVSLADVDELNIHAGGASFVVSMMTGGMIELKVGARSTYYEIQTQASTGPLWSALQRQWSIAKDNHSLQSEPSTIVKHPANGVIGIADELRKFAELRADGILTDDEFADQKRRLLSDSSSSANPAAKTPSMTSVEEPHEVKADARVPTGRRVCVSGSCEARGLPTLLDRCDVCGALTQQQFEE